MTLSDSVQAFYEGMSYPPVPIASVPGYAAYSSFSLAKYAQTGCWQPQKSTYRALVGGCGNGHELHLVAVNSPECCDIVGVDLSRSAITTAQERLAYHQLGQCRAQWGDLMQAETLPQGEFDFISSFGVLHHTANPVVALQNLASRLAPDGVMALMVYNASGRQSIYHFREVLALLGYTDVPQVADLLSAIQPGNQTASHLRSNASYYQHPENIADNFLHPQDLPFYSADLPAWLDQAGLEFIDVVPHGQYWCPDAFVSRANRGFYAGYDQLDRISQLTILEKLSPTTHTQNIFWCCHKNSATRSHNSTFPAYSPRDRWQLNPQFCQHATIKSPHKTVPFAQYESLDRDAPYQLGWPLIAMPRNTLHLSGSQLHHLARSQFEHLSEAVLQQLAATAIIMRTAIG